MDQAASLMSQKGYALLLHFRPSLSAVPVGTTTHCNTLQHTATHPNTLHHTAKIWAASALPSVSFSRPCRYYNTPQHTATHRNTPQHTPTRCITLQKYGLLLHFRPSLSAVPVGTTPVLGCVGVCCSVLQCVAVCCSTYRNG